LHLWVKPTLKKYWIFRFTINGNRRNIGLGSYPLIPLKTARIRAQKAALQVAEGMDPRGESSAPKAHQSDRKQVEVIFSEFALNWIETNRHAWRNDKHAEQWIYTLRNYAFDVIGTKNLSDIGESDILKILQPIWTSKPETASRLRSRLERILAAAKVKGLRDAPNPATWKGHLDAVLPSPKALKRQRGERHHKALPYRELPEFISKLRDQDGLAALALEFTILHASRTGEVLYAKWAEIKDGLWTIPSERMKAGREHRVPLLGRSIEILEIARHLNPESPYLFSISNRPLSNMAMLSVLKRLNPPITVHGFRSTFRDWIAEETEHSSEVAEMALAHTIHNKTEAAYRRGDLLERRRQLLQDWQTFCASKVFIK
jgi:integrase